MDDGYKSVTEIAGELISQEQLDRAYTRYKWAQGFCHDKDVLEVACGVGQGLGLLKNVAATLIAGDIDDEILRIAKNHYQDRIQIQKFPADRLEFKDNSLDVIIIFEAIYYLDNLNQFLKECARVLRKQGHLLMCMPNKDLYDFNPSPKSYKYYNAPELSKILKKYGFSSKYFGSHSVGEVSLRQKLLRPIKKLAVTFNLMPQSMAGKKLLKRFVFGKMVPMPSELIEEMGKFSGLDPLSSNEKNAMYKVLYCDAQKQ
jgi:ubiquinone/menaquinone biosynthesis C-methylase UbiE